MFGTSRNRPLIPEREGSSAVLPAMDYHAARTPDLPIQAKNKGADNVMMTENRDAEKATRPFAGALEENPLDGMSTEERKRAERRLVRKIDLLVMPIACMLYLLAYMDRGVIGNAKLQGLQDDVLGNSSTNYDTAVSVYFAGYIAMQVPANFALKIFRPSWWVGGVAIAWGVVSTLQTVCTNPAGLYACRIFLGITEAGFGPSLPLYFSFFYTRAELGMRTSLFIGSAAAAGAFSGMIAYGTAQIHSYLANWKILFLIEGLPTILFGIIALFVLPDRPEKTRYFNKVERALAMERINNEVATEAPGTLDKSQILPAFANLKMYFLGVLYMGMNVALASIGAFLPSIIKTLGFSAARAQLMTVPPYSVAFVVMIINAYLSDKLRSRGVPLIILGTIAGIGYIVLDCVHENMHVRYFCTFLICAGTYAAIPTTIAWSSNNSATETQRAVAIGVVIGIGHVGSIIGSHIYEDSDKPKYTKGFSICAGFVLLAALIAALLHIWYQWENKKKQDKFGSPDEYEGQLSNELGEKSPAFRYMT